MRDSQPPLKQMSLKQVSEAADAISQVSRNGPSRLFQTRGPAIAKLLSSNLALVCGTTHVRASANLRRRLYVI